MDQHITAKGLTGYIYRSPLADCTAGGISAHGNGITRVTITGIIDTTAPGFNHQNPRLDPMPADSQVVTPSASAPPVWLVIRQMGLRRVVHLVPAQGTPVQALWAWMAGGSFVESGDSRIANLTQMYGAISLHDRTEYAECKWSNPFPPVSPAVVAAARDLVAELKAQTTSFDMDQPHALIETDPETGCTNVFGPLPDAYAAMTLAEQRRAQHAKDTGPPDMEYRVGMCFNADGDVL